MTRLALAGVGLAVGLALPAVSWWRAPLREGAAIGGVSMTPGEMQAFDVRVGAAEVRDVEDALSRTGIVDAREETGTTAVVFVEVAVPELGLIRKDAMAVTVVAGHPPLTGNVTWLGEISTATGTARARCELADAEGVLGTGKQVEVEIAIGRRPAIAIPREAIVLRGQIPYVFVEVERSSGGSRFMPMYISTEELTDMPWVPLPHGMEPGTRLVVHGAGAVARRLSATPS